VILIPDHLGISELRRIAVNYGVVRIGRESEATIVRVRDSLRLWAGLAIGVLRKCVNGNNAVVLIWEEAGCVIHIDHSAAGEYKGL
jgi:hypothetical protein